MAEGSEFLRDGDLPGGQPPEGLLRGIGSDAARAAVASGAWTPPRQSILPNSLGEGHDQAEKVYGDRDRQEDQTGQLAGVITAEQKAVAFVENARRPAPPGFEFERPSRRGRRIALVACVALLASAPFAARWAQEHLNKQSVNVGNASLGPASTKVPVTHWVSSSSVFVTSITEATSTTRLEIPSTSRITTTTTLPDIPSAPLQSSEIFPITPSTVETPDTVLTTTTHPELPITHNTHTRSTGTTTTETRPTADLTTTTHPTSTSSSVPITTKAA